MLALQVPQGHVDGGHGGDADRSAAEVHRAAIHLLPQPLGFQRIFADEDFAQAAGNVVAERRVDDRLDHLGRSVGLANAFQARLSVRTRTSTASWLLAVLASTLLTRSIWQTICVIFMECYWGGAGV